MSTDSAQQKPILPPTRLGDLVVLIIGGLLALAFAPMGYSLLAIICPALLLLTWRNVSPSRALWRGWLFGLGFFGVGISWVYISIHVYGKTGVPLSIIITALFVAILALFPAIQGYLLNRFFNRSALIKALIAFPTLWVLLEWVRTWLFTGFPWLFLGYSQINSPLHGYAPLIGVYGLSFLLCLTAGLIYLVTYAHWKKVAYFAIPLLLIWVPGLFLSQVQWTKPSGPAIETSIIQGNIPQSLKWDPQQFKNTLNTYKEMTDAHWKSQLIVWPEAAITLSQNNVTGFLSALNKAAKTHDATIITGIPYNQDGNYYNAMLSLGTGKGHYFKRHLVPFGEYVPLQNYLRGIINFFNLPMSNFSAGEEQQAPLYANGHVIAPFICYEIAYPQEVLNAVNKTHFIITISDDSWFGHSMAQDQHLQIAQMRSLETGRSQIFGSNDGITALINAQGQVYKDIPPYTRQVLTGDITPMQGRTPLMIWGNNVIIGIMILLLLLGLLLVKLRKK